MLVMWTGFGVSWGEDESSRRAGKKDIRTNGSGHGSEKRGTGCGGRSRGEEVSPVD